MKNIINCEKKGISSNVEENFYEFVVSNFKTTNNNINNYFKFCENNW